MKNAFAVHFSSRDGVHNARCFGLSIAAIDRRE